MDRRRVAVVDGVVVPRVEAHLAAIVKADMEARGVSFQQCAEGAVLNALAVTFDGPHVIAIVIVAAKDDAVAQGVLAP